MRKYFIYTVLAAGLSVIFSSFCLAAGDFDPEIKIYLGESKVIPVDNLTRIAVGNPNVIDVTQAAKQSITLTPVATGKTTLVYWDNFGEQSYIIKVISEDLTDAKRRIDDILKELSANSVYTSIKEEEGKVFLLGSVTSAAERERLFLALASLKDKIVDLIQLKEEESVVEIDVQVMELNKDATKTLGLTWPASISLTEVGSPGIASTGSKWSTLFKVLSLKRDAFVFSLDALAQEGKARILSRPQLACQSGKEAELLVGGEKPIFSTQIASSGSGSGTGVEYKEYGIKLNIKPTVLNDDKIKIALKVEVSEVGAAESIGTSGGTSGNTTTARAYPLTKRNASTELFLINGQTMAIGGLIKQKAEEDVRKVPWLADVPIVGFLFRKKTVRSGGGQGERGDSELFITITPTIINKKTQQPEQIDNKSPESQDDARVNIDKIPDSVSSYTGLIKKRISESIIYPPSAREGNYQGTVKLSLHLSSTGDLLDIFVKSSSGYEVLDENALLTAKKISSYPPFPTSIEDNDIWIDVPIAYNLN